MWIRFRGLRSPWQIPRRCKYCTQLAIFSATSIEGNPRTHPQPQGGCTDHDDKNDALLEEFVVNMNAELGRQGTNAIIQPLPDTKGLHGAERSQVMTKSQEGWERFTDGTDDHYAIKVAIIILSKRLFLSELTAPCILALLKVGPPHL